MPGVEGVVDLFRSCEISKFEFSSFFESRKFSGFVVLLFHVRVINEVIITDVLFVVLKITLVGGELKGLTYCINCILLYL